MSFSPKATDWAAGANKRRRATALRTELALMDLAALAQPVSALQVANRLKVGKSYAGRELTKYTLIPWLHVETVPEGRYRITVDVAVKALCARYQPGPTLEAPNDFYKRLQRGIAARRKEVEVKSHGSWVPDQIPKMGLIGILNWIDAELIAFRNGHSVTVREGAEPMPQCGQEKHCGQEDQV